MTLTDADHEALAQLARDNHITFSTYSDLAKTIGKRMDFLDTAMRVAEKDAESARDAARVADDANDDLIALARDLVKLAGPHAMTKPTEAEVSAIARQARELLAQNGIQP